MKKYEKPVVMINEELAEGVYAASGGLSENECWTISVKRDQVDAGGYSTYRIYADHNTALQHVSTCTEITITFALEQITKAEYEDKDVAVTVSGNIVTLKREAHGNSYLSGDNFKSLLKVWTVSGSAPEEMPSSTIKCTRTVNVQGNF